MPPVHIVVYLFNKFYKYRFTCRHPGTKNLLLNSGDMCLKLTGAPCMPLSPGPPGNPG